MSQPNILNLIKAAPVEWKTLKQVTLQTQNIRWQESNEHYRYIDLSSVDIFNKKITDTSIITAANAPSRAQKIVKTNDVIFATTRPTQQRYCLINNNYDGEIVSTGYCVLRANQTKVLPKWILHWLSSTSFKSYLEENQSGSAYPAISDAKVKEFKIPIPPLDIQQEIVRILDTFTAVTSELTSELSAREKQYNYYRDQLLSFDTDKVEWKVLGDVATIGTGRNDTQDAVEDGDYVFYARGRDPLRLNTFDFDETAIITAGDGAGVGKVFHYVQGKYALHQRAYRIVPSEMMNSRFVYHCIRSSFYWYIQKASVNSSVTSLRRAMFLNFPIPVPSLAEQARIVAILDKFDTLTSSLSEGLPREIELRQKQYEYYREQLLSFPKPA